MISPLLEGILVAVACIVSFVLGVNVMYRIMQERLRLDLTQRDMWHYGELWNAEHPEETPINSDDFKKANETEPEDLKQYTPTEEDPEFMDAATAIMQGIHDIMNEPEEVKTNEQE